MAKKRRSASRTSSVTPKHHCVSSDRMLTSSPFECVHCLSAYRGRITVIYQQLSQYYDPLSSRAINRNCVARVPQRMYAIMHLKQLLFFCIEKRPIILNYTLGKFLCNFMQLAFQNGSVIRLFVYNRLK